MVSLYEHQKAELEATKDLTHVAYYHDMGLGKTFTGAAKLMQLGAKVNLLVCQKSKINDWLEHFTEHYGEEVMAYDLTREHELAGFVQAVEVPWMKIGVINYELAWRRPLLRGFLESQEYTLMLDESSLIQNDKAKRSKWMLSLHPKNVVLLSGTPTGGKYERLWSQLHLLGWDISRKLYWAQFVTVKYLEHMGGRGRGIPVVTGYRNVERLKRKMKLYGCRFLKSSEVFDMPAQTFTKVYCKTSGQYVRFRKTKIAEVDGRQLVGDTTLTKMLYERQLCGQYSKAKVKAFTDLVESTEDRLIVFYNFTDEMRAMREAIGANVKRDVSYSIVNGNTKDLVAYERYADSITFVQYQAGAMGLNLQKANKVIYFTLPLSSELYEQSKKRVHRIGQEQPCFYYQLLVKGSVEEKILAALEMRCDYTERLFERDEILEGKNI